ncbi:glycosyltransferase [Clostridium beijerinckii]|uniref:glycosyltransferase n=1 Tax=Clostridium beijerinckii TaxID=1520 RepID=UPI0009B85AB7|nr:glycosyltransferase [Clostridium beijerinckii]
MIFDQYQRYRTLQTLVESVKKYYNIQQLNILEVGSNEQLNLERFLPNENITYSDLSIPQNISLNDKFIEADATDLRNINDNEFDIVISSDVFEHIPKIKREDFLKETSRVAKLASLHCFPFESKAIVSAEASANEYYKSMFGINHIWLQEHIDNGLPDEGMLKDILSKFAGDYFMFEHGDILLWEDMTKLASYTEYVQELLPLRKRIEDFYQQSIYVHDIGEKNYRKFVVLANDKNLLNEVETTIANIFDSELPERYLKFLYKSIEDIRAIAQLPITREKFEKNVQATLYLDSGNGFNEKLKINQDYKIYNSRGNIDIFVDINEDVKNIRFDPIEGRVSVINGLSIISNNGVMEYNILNGFCVDDSIIFDNNDPQIEINCVSKSIRWLKIQGSIYAFEDVVAIDILSKLRIIGEKENSIKELNERVLNKENYVKELSDCILEKENNIKDLEDSMSEKEKNIQNLISELENYKLHYNSAITQRNELAAKLSNTEIAYNIILNSTMWKITKPVRIILDYLKSFLKSNRCTHIICKGLKCLKQNGFKYTFDKVKQKFKNAKGYNNYAKQNLLTDKEKQIQINTKFSKDIKFSIVVPLYNTPENFLCEMINSCIDQTYDNWELCLADGSDQEHKYVKKIVADYIKKDNRIKYKTLERNGGISENTNEAIKMATGDYIALFDHDDLLHPSALFEYMKVICEKNADFIYCDELTFEGTLDKIVTMHFKPDFAIDNLRANNYICHFTVFKSDLLNTVGMFRKEFDGSQDHDMILRLTDEAESIVHVPKILYFWRSHPNSVASDINSKTYAIDAGKRAVKDHLRKNGLDAIVESSKAFPTIYKFTYEIKEKPLISILIPNKDSIDVLSRCIESILNKSTYKNIEIIIIENNSTNKETFEYYKTLEKYNNIKVIIYESNGKFNYSAINNFGVKHANGEHLLFLNNDIEVISENWIEEMLMYSQRKDVGGVGAKLYYPNDTIQHAGVILKLGTHRCAGHCHYRCSRENLGYMGRLYYAQNFSAVTAACLMMKKSIFNEINGFNEDFAVAFNDVDLCMRIRNAGYLIVWTPYAEAYHYESISRGHEDTPEKQERFNNEVAMFKTIWEKEIEQGDPYYNPNLTLDRDDFSIK